MLLERTRKGKQSTLKSLNPRTITLRLWMEKLAKWSRYGDNLGPNYLPDENHVKNTIVKFPYGHRKEVLKTIISFPLGQPEVECKTTQIIR